ncbi:hypothetical protein J4558_12680 [Leptolyngbya sp. 15MV]|nr:hypothetical protein J4558_12680 [Leptolyngbya sp. 15MV]
MIVAPPDLKPADLVEFAWIWNRRARQGTPALHRRILRWLEDQLAGGDRRLLLMAFRGAGKSTLIGLFCAWRLYREPDTRILVLAADHALATRMVATVRRILARHPLCGALLPGHGEGEWAADRFTVAREQGLSITARLPFLGDAAPVLLLSPTPPDPSGDDRHLVRLPDAALPAGAVILARDGGEALAELPGFRDPGGAILGAYAAPLSA